MLSRAVVCTLCSHGVGPMQSWKIGRCWFLLHRLRSKDLPVWLYHPPPPHLVLCGRLFLWKGSISGNAQGLLQAQGTSGCWGSNQSQQHRQVPSPLFYIAPAQGTPSWISHVKKKLAFQICDSNCASKLVFGFPMKNLELFSFGMCFMVKIPRWKESSLA